MGKKKRMRLPNGFGQITELKNRNLREPFRAMVTVGKNEVGKPICKLLKPKAYFRTYNDAYAALVEYHRNPYDLDSGITVKELYERWSTKYFDKLGSDSSINSIKVAWKYCTGVYNMKVTDLRIRHIKGCMEDGAITVKGIERKATPNTQSRIKSIFNQMLDYAVEYELVDKNCARSFALPDDVAKEKGKVQKEHIPFTDEEMNILWDHVSDVLYADIVTIQCYSGWRPQELGLIRLEDVDLENWSFIGGMKTDAGEERFVPIHEKIRGLVKDKYEQAVSLNSKYLFNCVDSKTKSDLMFTYAKYQKRFKRVMSELELSPNHRAHDPRMQFVTMCKRNNVDEYAIKYMAGHAISDITEKVYTKRDNSWLYEEIGKIK